MKIAVISPGPVTAPGGVEAVVWALASGLAANREHQVEVWAYDTAQQRPCSSIARDVTIRQFPAMARGPFTLSPSLFSHARAHGDRFDVVHVHNYHSSASASVLLLPKTATAVMTPHFHGGGHTRIASLAHRPYGLLGRRILARADAVIAVSAAELSNLVGRFPIVSDKGRVIRNGVDSEDILQAQPFEQNAPVLLIMGRHERYKRIHEAIQQFGKTTAAGRLVILGDGPERKFLENCAAATSRAKDITFFGFVDRAAALRWLRTATGVVNLSEHEAFGLSALEAAGAGAHSVLSDIPAHREIAQEIGLDRASLVSRFESLPELFERLLRGERLKPHPVRSWPVVVRDHLNLYASLCAARAHGVEG